MPRLCQTGHDHTQDHLIIFPSGHFGCVVFQGLGEDEHQHRRRIWQLAGKRNGSNADDPSSEPIVPPSRFKTSVRIIDLGSPMPHIKLSSLTRDPDLRFTGKGSPRTPSTEAPGEVVPLTSLPADHPALKFLQSRGFQAQALEEQFGSSFCMAESPGRRHRTIVGDFPETPKGRIIFFAQRDGVCTGWLGRLLEIEDEHCRSVWHPDKLEWVQVMSRTSAQTPWEPLSAYSKFDPSWKEAPHTMAPVPTGLELRQAPHWLSAPWLADAVRTGHRHCLQSHAPGTVALLFPGARSTGRCTARGTRHCPWPEPDPAGAI